MGLSSNSPVVLTVVTAGASYSRSFSIKVTQIECDSLSKAANGCLQYYQVPTWQKGFLIDEQSPTTRASPGQCSPSTTTEAAGCSFQTPTTACLSPIISSTKDASRCVRMERNFCGIEYTACDDTINPSPQSFSVSGSSNTGSQVNFPSDCQLIFLKF